MRNLCLHAPLLKYNRVEDLIERLLEAKHNVHKSVRNFLQNVFTQKIVASSDKFSGWTEYDSLILGNLSPRSVQKLTFQEIHTVLLNDLSERTLLWVARVNQELMQTLHTAINTAAFTGFQVLSTRIRGRDIISPHFKTLDESVLRAAENVINNFFTLHNPYPISRKEEHNRSKSLFIDFSYSNSMNSLFDANFVRVSHEHNFRWSIFKYKFHDNVDDELHDLCLSATPLDDYMSGFILTMSQWNQMKLYLAFLFSKNDLYDRDVCAYVIQLVLSPNSSFSSDYVW